MIHEILTDGRSCINSIIAGSHSMISCDTGHSSSNLYRMFVLVRFT